MNNLTLREQTIQSILNDPIDGAILPHDQFALVEPCILRNDYLNPGFEIEPENPNYTNIGLGTLVERTTEQQYSGAFSLKVDNSGALVLGGVQFSNVSDVIGGETYTLSFQLLCTSATELFIQALDTANVIVLSKSEQYNSQIWQRLSITWTIPIGETTWGWAVFVNSGTGVDNPPSFYIDDVQFNQGSNINYVSGDLGGSTQFIGLEYLSPSVTEGKDYRIGYVRPFVTHYNILILGVNGLDMGNQSNHIDELPFIGGGFYQRSINTTRTITFSIAFCGSPEAIAESKGKFFRDIEHTRLGNKSQPVRILYQPIKPNCEPMCECLFFDVIYQGGARGEYTDINQERYDITFRTIAAGWTTCKSKGVSLELERVFEDASGYLVYDPEIGWTLDTLVLPDPNGVVLVDEMTQCGNQIAMVGNFATVNNANAHLMFYNGEDATGYTLPFALQTRGPNGYRFACVSETEVYMVNGQDTSIIYFDGTTFVDIQVGAFTNGGLLYDVEYYNGFLYLVGEFDEIDGNPAYSVVQYNIASGTFDIGTAIVEDLINAVTAQVWHINKIDDTHLVIGGLFNLINTVEGAFNIAQLNFDMSVENLGGDDGIGDTATVNDIVYNTVWCNGILYAITADIPKTSIYSFNGTQWEDVTPAPDYQQVTGLTCCEGSVLVSHTTGVFQILDQNTFANYPVRYNSANTFIFDIFCDKNGRVILAVDSADAIVNGTTEICANTILPANSTLVLQGPMNLKYIKNAINNKSLDFDYLINEGEILRISIVNGRVDVYSSTQGNITGQVLAKGSSLDSLKLYHGPNIIEVYVEDLGYNSQGVLYWQDKFNSAAESCVDFCQYECI